MNQSAFSRGVRRGLPVGVGYFSVSFGFGAMAAAQGINALDATLISATNLTSAGQFAGLTLILASAGLWEMVLTMLVTGPYVWQELGIIPQVLPAIELPQLKAQTPLPDVMRRQAVFP